MFMIQDLLTQAFQLLYVACVKVHNDKAGMH